MKKYKDDYEIIITKDKKGKEKQSLNYLGAYFEVMLEEDAIRRFRIQSLLTIVTIIILHIGRGFIKNQGMYQFYISLPYVLAFYPLWNMASGSLRLPKKIRKYRHDEIGRSFDLMKRASFILMALLGIEMLGQTIFILFFANQSHIALEYAHLTLTASAIVLLYILIRKERQVIVQPSNK